MFIPPKSVQQVAALPFVWSGDDVLVLLVTSRSRKRWIIPKGWPVKNRALSWAAAREAEEEAGLFGVIQPDPVGFFHYQKEMSTGYEVRCSVGVFPMLVIEQRRDWKERKERKLKWCRLNEAALLVDDAELAQLLRDLPQAAGTGLIGDSRLVG